MSAITQVAVLAVVCYVAAKLLLLMTNFSIADPAILHFTNFNHYVLSILMLVSLGTSPSMRSFLSKPLGNSGRDLWLAAFLALAVFKGVKVIIHTISYCFLTRPARICGRPTLFPHDVTVIVPILGIVSSETQECIKSILASGAAQIIVSTFGPRTLQQVEDACREISEDRIKVVAAPEANKRQQLLLGASEVETSITAYADETAFWPPTLLRGALAAMEDPLVGLVGTAKRVRRNRTGGLRANILNYIGCMKLERTNFECTATYNIDGGVYCISGRTALIRTSIIQCDTFQESFLNEKWSSPFKTVGPIKVGDDSFITRFMVNNGWKTVFHNSDDAIVETVLGHKGVKKFHGQLKRWVRTRWRSFSTSLFVDRVCWQSQPWTTYAMYVSSFVNFALFYDGALFYTLARSGYGDSWWVLALFLLVTKVIKPLPHLLREPRDWVYLPFGILFGYIHSFYKLYALFTASNIEWSGREGQGIKATG